MEFRLASREWPPFAAALIVGLVIAALLVPVASAHADGCDPGSVRERGNVWTVRPTGGDDTANIQCALDEASAAGGGAVVRLSAGHFEAGLLTGTNLHGSFTGAGVERTTLSALPDLDCQSRIDIGRGTTWIYFNGGDVHVSHIAFEVNDPAPCAPWTAPGSPDIVRTNLFGGFIQFGGPGTGGLTDCDVPDPHEVDARVTDAAFRATPFDLDATFPAVDHGVWISGTIAIDCPPGLWWPVTGSFSVQRSVFENVRVGVEATGLADGRLIVGGSPGNGNTFVDTAEGVSGVELSDASMVVSHNRIDDAKAWGVLVVQGIGADGGGYPVPLLSQFVVRNNTIVGVGFADGVGVIDLGPLISGDKSVDVQVMNNAIHLDDVEFGGVFGFGSQDVVVKNNAFTGAGATSAVYHGVEGEPSGGWQIVGNDVSAFTAGVAKIWLGTGSFDDYVKTMNPTDDVLDEGTNNTILGPGRSTTVRKASDLEPFRSWDLRLWALR